MIALEEAQAFVLAACGPRPAGDVAIDEALGCVVARPVVATEPVPPFANSAMDGYAVRAADTRDTGGDGQRRLRVVGTIMAGTGFGATVGPGEAVRIMTGAPVPDGADAVCMLEEAVEEPARGTVRIGRPLSPGDFVRQPAEDVAVGAEIIGAGTVLAPGHLGVLADQGLETVHAHRRPRVGVLSTGDELISGAAPLRPGQIRDANRHTLLAMARREGWRAVDLGIVGDDETAVEDRLLAATGDCDAVVTSGGVSMGDLDVVKMVLRRLSDGTMRWVQVAIKPAKPFAFGTLQPSGTPVFGLPGNPVSAMVSFELFVRPALRALSGHRHLWRPEVVAIAGTPLRRRPDGKTHFVRATATMARHGSWRVAAVSGQGSHHLRAMADANALAVLPDGDGVAAEHPVRVLLIDPERLSAS